MIEGMHVHPHADGSIEEEPSYYEHLTTAMLELLVEKGVVTADAVRREIEAMERRSPAAGARVVARAWLDAAYRSRLLEDGSAAIAELGIEPGGLRLIVVENTPGVHNVIVCTLCSCYPRMLLGIPPAWYKSRPYRARVVREPRAVLAEFGLALPATTQIRVHDSTADMRYLVLPLRPPGTEAFDEAALAALVSRDAMIGTAVIAP